MSLWFYSAFVLFMVPMGSVLGANVACQEVRYQYSAQGMDVYEVPLTPQKDAGLEICPRGPTCCTRDMEVKLGHWSSRQYKEAVTNKTNQMANPFNSKANKVQDFMENLFSESRQKFDNFFSETYGTLYVQNRKIFDMYFLALEDYFRYGHVDVAHVTQDFFGTIFQKMFMAMNPQYEYSEQYQRCIKAQMESVKPFGEVPKELASKLKSSLVATRILHKSVQSAFEIVNQMSMLEPTKECLKAVQKMNSCPACQGYAGLKPCSNYCINVMKGCLVFHIEMQQKWDDFAGALETLGERLQGAYDFEMIIMESDVKISDAIMELQTKGAQATEKVFNVNACGRPRIASSRKLGKREVHNEDIGFEDQVPEEAKMTSTKMSSSAKDLVRANFRKSSFDKLVKEIKKVMGNSVGFWKELPFTLCDQPNPEFQEKNFGWKAPLINDQCWNGRDNGPYRSDIVQDGLENWVKNPEMESHNARIAEPLILKEQSGKLLKITNELKSAHSGEDVDWWDQEPEVTEDNDEYEGSGSGDYESPGFSDDEDYDDIYDHDYHEGSGSGDDDYENEDTEDPEVPWETWTPPATEEPPTEKPSTSTPEFTTRIPVTPSSTVTPPSKPKDSGTSMMSANMAIIMLSTMFLVW